MARLRAATGDPLLVQAGRSLVPTPDHLEVTPASLERTGTIRANEGFMARFAPALVAAITAAAPRVCLQFTPKPNKDADPLREGMVDLEIGTSGSSAPEVKSQLLFRDHFIGVARSSYPILQEPMTPKHDVSYGHVVASRRGMPKGPVDDQTSSRSFLDLASPRTDRWRKVSTGFSFRFQLPS